MKKRFWVPSALLLVLSISCVGAHAQTGAGDTMYRLQGTVEDALTGKPLARALVASMDHRLATMTDPNGHFSLLISVPAQGQKAATGLATGIIPSGGSALVRSVPMTSGSLFLTAKKPGYLQQQQPTILALDETLGADPVELKLMPAAVIQGRVSADSTDEPQTVQVMLLYRQVQEGRYQWIQVAGQRTDSRGQFRLDNLRPGLYTVMSSVWGGDQFSLAESSEPTRQYSPTFLGGTSRFAEATKLQLHNGETENAELHLQATTFYPVSVAVSSAGPNNGINVRVLESGGFNGFQLRYNARAGAVEGALPNGAYTLSLMSFGPQPTSTSVSIQVAGSPLHTGPVALGPAAAIAVRVRTEFTSELTPQFTQQQAPIPRYLSIFLRPEEQGSMPVNGRGNLEDSGEITLENVQPGRYFVRAMPGFSSYVASMTSGEVNLLEQPLVVTPGARPDPIDITLRDDGATLTGALTGFSGVPPRVCPVVLLPRDPSGAVVQSAALKGSFKMQNVPPGSYLLVASPEVPQDIPYRDPEAMRAYAGIGAAVTVVAGQTVHADAPLVDQIVPKEP